MKSFFEGQLIHLIGLLILLPAVYLASDLAGFMQGRFLGISTGIWVVLAIADAVIHQSYVWICWRAQLHDQTLSRWFGEPAFVLYAVVFSVLILLRPILLLALGWANRGTLNIDPVLGYGVAIALVIPVSYLMYSVAHYFSFRRAFGIDHFDPSYRNAPLIRQGIFRWTSNAMYVFGISALWIPGFLFQSVAALVVAAFSHAYIWVHYFATEKPDMARIYGQAKDADDEHV